MPSTSPVVLSTSSDIWAVLVVFLSLLTVNIFHLKHCFRTRLNKKKIPVKTVAIQPYDKLILQEERDSVPEPTIQVKKIKKVSISDSEKFLPEKVWYLVSYALLITVQPFCQTVHTLIARY